MLGSHKLYLPHFELRVYSKLYCQSAFPRLFFHEGTAKIVFISGWTLYLWKRLQSERGDSGERFCHHSYRGSVIGRNERRHSTAKHNLIYELTIIKRQFVDHKDYCIAEICRTKFPRHLLGIFRTFCRISKFVFI